ncbi:MAG: hypothetical protein GWO19_01295, partial [Nitrospinaceae bacterium]|nr:hypothetical protein [Nitrospinaceae bacterium]NIS83828.1 hypothetical protein [Nitrospinaceae bacterium]NIU95024.1 hypothetical protein [Nitrospinaceae bacterium]
MTEAVKNKIIESILRDDLEEARSLLDPPPSDLEPLSALLKSVEGRPRPLARLTAPPPRFVVVFPSYTCGIGCRMCNAGFADRTELYEDYRYLEPHQFDAWRSWLDTASHVLFVGLGETLDSPHIPYFLDRTSRKETILYSSGVPLTRKKIHALIDSDLKFLTLSFDGKTAVGHGSGKNAYLRNFWEKVKLLQRIKTERSSKFPVVGLTITVNRENLDQLEELIGRARDHGIGDIMLTPMTVQRQELYEESIFSFWEEARDALNHVMKRWNDTGLHVDYLGFRKTLPDRVATCPYIDNWVTFNGVGTVNICEGPLTLPQVPSEFSREKDWNAFPMRYLRFLHFCADPGERPQACQACFITQPQSHSRWCDARYGRDASPAPAAIVETYRAASRLKKEHRFHEAEETFRQVIAAARDGDWIGKAYFHLGEMEVIRNRFPQALEHMKNAVRHAFDHRLA